MVECASLEGERIAGPMQCAQKLFFISLFIINRAFRHQHFAHTFDSNGRCGICQHRVAPLEQLAVMRRIHTLAAQMSHKKWTQQKLIVNGGYMAVRGSLGARRMTIIVRLSARAYVHLSEICAVSNKFIIFIISMFLHYICPKWHKQHRHIRVRVGSAAEFAIVPSFLCTSASRLLRWLFCE